VSTTVRTPQCYPEIAAADLARLLGTPLRPHELRAVRASAEHEKCPGGHHTPGVLGGWHCPCPCPCHRKDGNP
jgi:hypothetical protein